MARERAGSSPNANRVSELRLGKWKFLSGMDYQSSLRGWHKRRACRCYWHHQCRLNRAGKRGLHRFVLRTQLYKMEHHSGLRHNRPILDRCIRRHIHRGHHAYHRQLCICRLRRCRARRLDRDNERQGWLLDRRALRQCQECSHQQSKLMRPVCLHLVRYWNMRL